MKVARRPDGTVAAVHLPQWMTRPRIVSMVAFAIRYRLIR